MKSMVNSKNTAIAISMILVILHYYIRTYLYNNWTNVLGWDVLAYYLILPFTFIYHDPGMVNQSVVEYIFQQYNPSGTFYQAYQIPNGNWISMYTCGFAILFSPFFFIAHLWASLSSYPTDGFSFPYQYCIGNGVMVYIVAGIFLIRKVLLYFFSDFIVGLVLILLLLGTNYFHEATSEEVMPHAILFSAYAWIILLTIRWHDNPKVKTACWLGFASGLTILCRQSELFLMFLPLFWNVYNVESFKEKVKFLFQYKKHILFAGIFFMITPVIQMIQWKYLTGSFLFSSYQNTEGFDWRGDHILKVLFAYKKSWFLYTPMIILPIIGIAFMRKMSKIAFFPVLLFFIVHFYVISSWAAWWQGGSFGMRYFVESYAVMAIPFGFFLKRVSQSGIFLKGLTSLLAGFFLFLNLFQTWQFNNWMIDGYAMTKAYYWRIFLKTKATHEDKKLLEVQRDFKSEESFADPQNYTERTLAYFNYDDINSAYVEPSFIDTMYFKSGFHSCRLDKDHVFSPTYRIPFNAVTIKEHYWVKLSMDYFAPNDINESAASLVISFNHNKRFTLKYKSWDLEKFPFKSDGWNHIEVEYLTPYPLSYDDVMEVYVYSRGSKAIYIDNLHIKAYERKW